MALQGSVKLDVAGNLTDEEIDMDFDPVMRGTELFGPDFGFDLAKPQPGLTAYKAYDQYTDLTLIAFFDSSNNFVKFEASRSVEVVENMLSV